MNAKPWKTKIPALALLAILLATSAAATQIRSFSRATQIAASDLVVTGRVTSLSSFWDDGGVLIHTDATIEVDEVWKGSAPLTPITVRTPGGTVGGVRLEVEGAARFVEGENVVLFLRDLGNVWTPSGMLFGKFSIVGDGEDRFAAGSLPPDSTGPLRLRATSIALPDLREEVLTLATEELR